MSAIRINRQNSNLEILSKLLDSVAAKHNRRVKYNPRRRKMQFFGTEACKTRVIEETSSLLAFRR
jgi:hypothetical protein